jgi:hypothetical protein
MSCPDCQHSRATLIDGSETCTWSEAWRAQCEAIHILSIPDKVARREYLHGREEAGRLVKKGILQIRGEQACRELEALVRRVWDLSRRA